MTTIDLTVTSSRVRAREFAAGWAQFTVGEEAHLLHSLASEFLKLEAEIATQSTQLKEARQVIDEALMPLDTLAESDSRRKQYAEAAALKARAYLNKYSEGYEMSCTTHHICDCKAEELERLRKELAEQLRLNSMGQERELKLMTQVREARMAIIDAVEGWSYDRARAYLAKYHREGIPAEISVAHDGCGVVE